MLQHYLLRRPCIWLILLALNPVFFNGQSTSIIKNASFTAYTNSCYGSQAGVVIRTGSLTLQYIFGMRAIKITFAREKDQTVVGFSAILFAPSTISI